MRWWNRVSAAGTTCIIALVSDASNAAVDIRVNLAAKTMHVVSAEGGTYDWAVSTARKGYVTPTGTFGVQSLQRVHYSRKYHNSPMPHSIFFRGGYAIHGTYATASLGRAASHGCVRLSPEHAAMLFQMVKREGARITITAGAPADTRLADRRRPDVDASPRVRRVAATRRKAPLPPLAYTPQDAPDYDRWLADPSGR